MKKTVQLSERNVWVNEFKFLFLSQNRLKLSQLIFGMLSGIWNCSSIFLRNQLDKQEIETTVQRARLR